VSDKLRAFDRRYIYTHTYTAPFMFSTGRIDPSRRWRVRWTTPHTEENTTSGRNVRTFGLLYGAEDVVNTKRAHECGCGAAETPPFRNIRRNRSENRAPRRTSPRRSIRLFSASSAPTRASALNVGYRILFSGRT